MNFWALFNGLFMNHKFHASPVMIHFSIASRDSWSSMGNEPSKKRYIIESTEKVKGFGRKYVCSRRILWKGPAGVCAAGGGLA